MSQVTVSGVAAVINDLSQEIGEWSEGKGFHNDWIVAKQIMEDHDEPRHASAVVGMKLMLTVSELSEALETLRDNGADGVLNREGNFGEELADAVIRILDMAHMLNIPIGDEIMRKVEKNVDRPYLHGRKL